MKKLLAILVLSLLLSPAFCLAEENANQTLDDKLKGLDWDQIQDGQTIDLRDQEKQAWHKRYLPDILIVIGSVGAIESVLWIVRQKKKLNQNSK